MVSTVDDAAATRRQTAALTPSKASLKRSLPPLAMSEALPDEIPLDSLKTALPPLEDGRNVDVVIVKDSSKKNFMLGKDMHGSSLEITEPDHDDEVTGEKDAYMAGVLARYRKSLTEKTKYHLGALLNFSEPSLAVTYFRRSADLSVRVTRDFILTSFLKDLRLFHNFIE